MLRKLILAAALAALLLSFCTVFADQDGRSCWCNIDQYGCRITDEDSGEIYIMFWSEEARQTIMGTHSAPYKLVVRHPGLPDRLPIECGSLAASASEQGNKKDCQKAYDECMDLCDRSDCLPTRNSVGCVDKDECRQGCENDRNRCLGL